MRRVCVLTLFGLLVAPLAGASDDPNSALSKDEQKCVVEVNKNVAKVAKAQGKRICKCIKNGAKGKLLPGQTIEDCVSAANPKVSKATTKLATKVNDKCANQSPGFGVSSAGIDPNALNAAAIGSEVSLIHWIFGSDLDAVILPKKDPNDPAVKPTSKCQIDVAKAAKKCFDTKWKVFIKCKKNGLKGKVPPGAIDSAVDLETLCLQDPNEDTGQPDPKGKVEKACVTKLNAKIDKKCGPASGADLSRAFPLFDPNAADLRTFVDRMVECEFCLLVNEVDGLERNCDLFDDGLANGSCAGAGLACPPGETDCGGSCVDTSTDPNHCGSCGTLCSLAPNTTAVGCSLGSCEVDGCDAGFDDCNLTFADGCEAAILSDPNNCNGCGQVCSLGPNTTAVGCSLGSCEVDGCGAGFADCNLTFADGCETAILADPSNCGGCGQVCALANASETCVGGSCLIASCNFGFCDENSTPGDGCERDLDTNPICPASAMNLGTVRGDVGADSVGFSDEGETWFRVMVSEADSSFSCVDLSARVTLVPPAGTDYDLYVYCDNCVALSGSSTAGGSSTEEVVVRWDEACFLGVPTGTDSGRFIFVQVRYFSANTCDDWSLTVRGNTPVGPLTCSTL